MCDCNIYSRDMTPVKVDTGERHTFVYQSGSKETTLISGISMPSDIEYNRASWKSLEMSMVLKKV